MSGWILRPALWSAAALALPGTATALPETVPPAPARNAFEHVEPPDPASADLTVVGGLWSLRPGKTGTAYISVANGGPAEARNPVLTVALPKQLSASDTSGCRQAASSLTPQGTTTITCRWRRIKPVDHRLVPLKLKAARLRKSDAPLSRPKVTLQVTSETPELLEKDNQDSFTVRIRPLLPDPPKPPPSKADQETLPPQIDPAEEPNP
ncbi:hypothetical protein ABGB12_02430 [Actinocorallia sp. B10E7]|uniref:hypothetical protein n=1 Tax=Actinocorallia sp. B10E7 TaxID=3153558 RepID=UPI00325F2F2E